MYRRLSAAIAAAVLMAALAPAGAAAQDEPAIEAYGGFNYLFADVGGEVPDFDFGGAGFAAGFAFRLNDWLGVGAEVGYNSGDLDLPVITIFPAPEIDFDQWTVLFGPRFRITENERFRIGAQTMVGIARVGIGVEVEALGILTPGDPQFQGLSVLDLTVAETAVAAMFGLHFDVRLDDRVFWRVIEPDVLITGYGGDAQAHVRIGTSLGFEF